MSILIKLILIGIISFPVLCNTTKSTVVQTTRVLYEECSAHSQAGMLDCLAVKSRESTDALRQAEKYAAASISKWDEDKNYINIALAKLDQSNGEFTRYRNTQCELFASLSGGGAGNAHDMGRLACTSELNSRRATLLRDSIADLPLKKFVKDIQ